MRRRRPGHETQQEPATMGQLYHHDLAQKGFVALLCAILVVSLLTLGGVVTILRGCGPCIVIEEIESK